MNFVPKGKDLYRKHRRAKRAGLPTTKKQKDAVLREFNSGR